MDKILVVEDDSFFRQMYVDLLKEDGYEVDTVTSGARALELLSANDYQLVITELVIPGMSGIELLTRVKQQMPTVDVVLVTGHANVESAVLALKSGARDYLLKPFNHEEFKHTVALCFEQRRLINENYELKELLNLFQIGQNIANCIDMERLSAVVLDALTNEIGADRAIGLFHHKDDNLARKEFKGFSEEAAQKLAEAIRKNFCIETNDGSVINKINTTTLVSGAEFDGLELSEGLLLVIRSKGEVQGVVVIFNNPGQKLPFDYKQKSIQFLLEQSTLAFENASRYSNARDMLYIDELTGLFNYRYLDISLAREIKRADRFGSTVSMIFIDLDFFKGVNDTHGHLVGSQVLNEMGMLLKKSVREVDIVIRYGGDEFTVMLVETGEKGAATVAERIRRSIEGHTFLAAEGFNIRLTASLGYACYPADTQSKLELLELADKAMYQGKEQGKNCVFRATAIR